MLSRPRSTIARTARVFATLSLGVAVALADSVSAFAQNVPVVRDAEIEALVRDYARPIFKAAGLANDGIDIVLVNDQSFNAFVTGRRLFINTGALMTAETPNEIIGVIAHEAGHIAGGHQQKLRDQLERAKTMAIIATLLGAGAIVAGATTNSRNLAGAGMGWRRAARWRSAASSPISALRDDRRPLGDHLSQRHRPVRHGRGRRSTASRRHCRCRARRSTPTASAIRCRRIASPI